MAFTHTLSLCLSVVLLPFFILSGSFSACHVFIIIIFIGCILWNLRRTLYTLDAKYIYTHIVCINNNTSHAYSSHLTEPLSACNTHISKIFQNSDNKCAFNFNQKQWLMQTRSCFRNKKCVTEPLCLCILAHFVQCGGVVCWGWLCCCRFCFISISFQRKDFHHHLSLSWCQIVHTDADDLVTFLFLIFFFWEISCSCNRCHQSNLLTTVTSSSCHFSGHFICISCYYFGFFLFIVVLLSRSLFCWIFRRIFLFTFH